MSTYISMTYRPKEGILPTLDVFKEALAKIKQVKGYYIGSESAGKENCNHFQCWLNISTRIDNFQRIMCKIINKICPEDEDLKISLKLSTIKSHDYSYVLGYCMKEKGPFATNLSVAQLDEAVRSYQLREVVKTKSHKEHSSLGIDQIFRMIVDLHKEKKLTEFDCPLFSQFIRVYSKEISYTTRQKLRLETLQFYVNIELSNEQKYVF